MLARFHFFLAAGATSRDGGRLVCMPTNCLPFHSGHLRIPNLFALFALASACLAPLACSSSEGSPAVAHAGPTTEDGAAAPDDATSDAGVADARGSDGRADAGHDATAPGCTFVDGESYVSGPTCSKVKLLQCDGVEYGVNCNCRTATCTCTKAGVVYDTISPASGTCGSTCQDVYSTDLLDEQAACAIR
jgi:hypothetical protein